VSGLAAWSYILVELREAGMIRSSFSCDSAPIFLPIRSDESFMDLADFYRERFGRSANVTRNINVFGRVASFKLG
jgi:hypothetical protein